MFRFELVSPIVPKGRPRYGKGRIRSPKRTRAYEESLALSALACRGPQPMIEGPVSLTIQAFYQAPQGAKTERPCYGGGRRGDLDNVLKVVSDALNGVLYPDDRFVVELHAIQQYAPHGQDEVLVVTVGSSAAGGS